MGYTYGPVITASAGSPEYWNLICEFPSGRQSYKYYLTGNFLVLSQQFCNAEHTGKGTRDQINARVYRAQSCPHGFLPSCLHLSLSFPCISSI